MHIIQKLKVYGTADNIPRCGRKRKKDEKFTIKIPEQPAKNVNVNSKFKVASAGHMIQDWSVLAKHVNFMFTNAQKKA